MQIYSIIRTGSLLLAKTLKTPLSQKRGTSPSILNNPLQAAPQHSTQGASQHTPYNRQEAVLAKLKAHSNLPTYFHFGGSFGKNNVLDEQGQEKATSKNHADDLVTQNFLSVIKAQPISQSILPIELKQSLDTKRGVEIWNGFIKTFQAEFSTI